MNMFTASLPELQISLTFFSKTPSKICQNARKQFANANSDHIYRQDNRIQLL